MKIWLKRAAIALVGVAALAIVAVGAMIALVYYFEYPGGMPSSYRAADGDTRLTRIAREAAPIIASIDRFYGVRGECPRVSDGDLAELRKTLPKNLATSFHAGEIEFRASGAIVGWMYYSSDKDPSACQLSRKLGWDPDLVWLRHGEQTKWVFVPGDGSDEREIHLDIGP
jgi:hypothetical protein